MTTFPSNFNPERWLKQKANNSKIVYDIAETQVGVWEWAGKDNNPKVVEYFKESGNPGVKEDKVPWCAAFVGAVLSRAGLPNSGSLAARSYTEYGVEVVDIERARKGDIVVLKRGNQPWQGHVGFYVTHDDRRIWVLGGNQGDQVNIKAYTRDRLITIRRIED